MVTTMYNNINNSTEKRNISVYISQSQERLLKAEWKRKNVDEIETQKEYKETMKRKRTEDWSGKQLHGQFKRERERTNLVFPGIG